MRSEQCTGVDRRLPSTPASEAAKKGKNNPQGAPETRTKQRPIKRAPKHRQNTKQTAHLPTTASSWVRLMSILTRPFVAAADGELPASSTRCEQSISAFCAVGRF